MARKIGILSGTFDPIHDGHLALAAAAHEQLKLHEVLILVNGAPPGKAGVTPFEHRLAMVRLAAANIPYLIADREPVQRMEQAHSLATVEALRRDHPQVDFILLMGSEVFRGVERWADYAALIKLVGFGVAARAGDDAPAPNPDLRVYQINLSPVTVSSGALREEAAGGQPIIGTPTAVADYVRRYHLYGAK